MSDGDLPATGEALVTFKRSNLAPAEGFGRANVAHCLDDPMTRLAELDGFSDISSNNDPDGHEAIATRGAVEASLEYQRCTTLGTDDDLDMRPWLAALESILESSSAQACDPLLPVEVTQYLLLGDKYSAWDAGSLARLRVTHVLNAADTDARGPIDHNYQGLKYLQLDAEDDVVYPLIELHLQAAAGFIQSAVEGGGRCLIHCHAGINRSGTLAMAYLMLAENLSLLQAARRVAHARGTVVQNVNFRLQLLRWAWQHGLCPKQELPTRREAASQSDEDDEVSSFPSLIDLRPELLHIVLSNFTQARELAFVAMTCTALHALVLEAWAAAKITNVHSLGLASRIRSSACLYCTAPHGEEDRIRLILGHGDAEPVPWLLTALLSRLTGLHELHLRGLCGVSDELLRTTLAPYLSQLRVLDLSETAVGTRGVISLQSMPCLESLNITFCELVSYAAVVALRDASPRLRHIRRQPRWLDGHFDTPWGETHTYYPCGAFSFDRTMQSKGWVAQMRQHGRPCIDAAPDGDGNRPAEDCVVTTYLEDRLIFLDRHAYSNISGRIGVCLFPHPEHDGRVIVVQSTVAFEPPKLSDEILSPSMWPDEGQTVRLDDQQLMISCMRVRPLSEGCHEPPADLHAELREFCTRRALTLDLSERCFAERVAFYSCHAKDALGPGNLEMAETELMQQIDDGMRHALLHDSRNQDDELTTHRLWSHMDMLPT